MSSNNDCIKFHLNIEDPNIVFSDYFKKYINGKYHNLYVAELIQPACPYCHSTNLSTMDWNKPLENTHWVMQGFMFAIQDKDEKRIIHLLNSKQALGEQMHQAFLIFKHNYTRIILNSISSAYSNSCLKGFNRKIKQIVRTTYDYSNFKHLLIRIRLEENLVKEKNQATYSLLDS